MSGQNWTLSYQHMTYISTRVRSRVFACFFVFGMLFSGDGVAQPAVKYPCNTFEFTLKAFKHIMPFGRHVDLNQSEQASYVELYHGLVDRPVPTAKCAFVYVAGQTTFLFILDPDGVYHRYSYTRRAHNMIMRMIKAKRT